MKISLLICLILVHFQSNQCGVVKNLVETVANEVSKVTGYIENGSNGTFQDKIEINTNAKHEEAQSVLSNEIISELQNSTNLKNNTTIQVNVDINLFVNYNIPNKKLNVSIEDINKDALTTNNPLNSVTDPSLNIEQSSVKVTSINVTKANTNIKFPGPMSSPIITYNDGVVIVEKNTTDERVLFPDSKIAIKPGCPNGMFLTENGYCLIDNQREKESGNDNDAVSRSAFSAGCLHGFARALDGSCQEVID